VEAFLAVCSYLAGPYDGDEGFAALEGALTAGEASHPACPTGRLFYLALPPNVYPPVCAGLRRHCARGSAVEGSWVRVIVEKPFGRDLASSEALAEELGELFPEDQLYRIDHYLVRESERDRPLCRGAAGR
jgi:glucose-6-phosphate 1-dehydrogenase